MRRYYIASHGKLASGMVSAVEMITGSSKGLVSYDLSEYKLPDAIYDVMYKEINENPNDEYIIFTDLLGGSVHNSLLCLCNNKDAYLISGMNLGMILEVILNDNCCDISELIDKSIQSSAKNTFMLNHERVKGMSEGIKEGFE